VSKHRVAVADISTHMALDVASSQSNDKQRIKVFIQLNPFSKITDLNDIDIHVEYLTEDYYIVSIYIETMEQLRQHGSIKTVTIPKAKFVTAASDIERFTN
jgi:hypothetical protein